MSQPYTLFRSRSLSFSWRACCSLVLIAMVLCPFANSQTTPPQASDTASSDSPSTAPIQPWSENPWFWSYHDQPVLLIGGSDDDNLFQWPSDRLTSQLDRLAAAGGNVVRNTMSDRKDGGWEVYPFAQLPNGKYDLDQWNPEYWQRWDHFLKETAARRIFVQLEIWDRFDYTDSRANDPKRWQNHPYNPINNINYTQQETGLAATYPKHPGANDQPFFYSTPKQKNLRPLLQRQQQFVDRLLESSLKYDHVLYCIDNETSGDPAWGQYWAQWIQKRASQQNKTVPITEMWDDWNLRSGQHRHTFDHPQVYSFVDVSQNNHNHGQKHWDNFQFVRNYLREQPRPINTTKIYGADGNSFGHTDQDAIERFWRHLLGGAASVRFHRPDSGLGLNDKAVACIRSARRVEAAVPFWNLLPSTDRIGQRQDNECYAAATENDSTLILYFPPGQQRSVTWQSDAKPNLWQVTWWDIDRGQMHSQQKVTGLQFSPPESVSNALAIIKNASQPLFAGKLWQCDGHSAFLMLPPEPLRETPQPWILYGPTLLPNYPDEHERWMIQQFLNAGIAIAGIDTGESYGSPTGVAANEALYQHLIKEEWFSQKVTVLGRSRGGLWVSNWAAQHPDRILALAGIYPAFDLRSYPGLEAAANAYDLTPQQLQAELQQWNPIAKADKLAQAAIPVFLIHGQQDQVVPWSANAAALQQLYQSAGQEQRFHLTTIADQGHNYWPGFFRDPDLIQFVIQHTTVSP